MKRLLFVPRTGSAILSLAEIKKAIAAFDRGNANVFATLDTIAVVIEDHRRDCRKPAPPRPKAA